MKTLTLVNLKTWLLLVFKLTLILIYSSCNENSKVNQTKSKTLTIDSNSYITITSTDSLNNDALEAIQNNLENYFNSSSKFNIDTFSLLNSKTIALSGKARTLQRRLLLEIPKYSLTTIEAGEKVTRTYYIVEGDINLDKDELYYYCLKRLQKKYDSNSNIGGNLTLGTDLSGNPAKWPSGTTIKYTIMKNSFSPRSRYDMVVNAMQEASKDWMQVCNIKFEHKIEYDNQELDLESVSEEIIFIVRQLDVDERFIAKAFFPSDPVYKRNLILNSRFFTTNFNKVGILRHELGHVLGFRHEHIWSPDIACFGENIIEDELGAIQETQYDPYSVMHYPCGLNKNNTQLNLTEFDKEGARRIYPF
ncbi:MAG: matrixin family metalloprotease [Saprospiraceae bacterium]|nr:matrixin family metalloprotease [Saprospiraceae bacterium]MBK8853907.1 matrixin family metalloprotease [Saprospiraceae bacterium]